MMTLFIKLAGPTFMSQVHGKGEGKISGNFLIVLIHKKSKVLQYIGRILDHFIDLMIVNLVQ